MTRSVPERIIFVKKLSKYSMNMNPCMNKSIVAINISPKSLSP